LDIEGATKEEGAMIVRIIALTDIHSGIGADAEQSESEY
jgi:hypothetical protein